MSETRELRTLLAPMAGSSVLVPSSVVAEVIDYHEPDFFNDAPDWLLGELKWNGWQVPVIHFALLAGTTEEVEIAQRSRVLVIKTLSESASVLHIGFVINGLPKLKNVTTSNLAEQDGPTGNGVFSHVIVDNQAAIIPDLDELAGKIETAVYTH